MWDTLPLSCLEKLQGSDEVASVAGFFKTTKMPIICVGSDLSDFYIYLFNKEPTNRWLW